MHWIVGAFASFIAKPLRNQSCFRECSRVVAGVELLTERSVLLNVLLDQLIHTQVKHVILYSDITTSCVNLKTLLMINYDYLC